MNLLLYVIFVSLKSPTYFWDMKELSSEEVSIHISMFSSFSDWGTDTLFFFVAKIANINRILYTNNQH